MIDNVKFSKKKDRKRKGRGIAAGQGKTAGRGTKGQGARSGANLRPTFEGGQTPLVQRLPKLKGFKSLKQPLQEVKVGDLQKIKGKTINYQTLAEHGVIEKNRVGFKVIGGGDLTTAKNVTAQAISKGAKSTVEKTGGSVTIQALHVSESKK